MLTSKRQEEIVRLVNERKSITVQELREIFDASDSTIRRDITALHNSGRIIKVFGGAVANDDIKLSNHELSVAQKETVNVNQKNGIAKYAAGLIRKDDCVYIDAGTTTGYMLEYITEKEAVYVTNAVAHAKTLANRGFKVILIGGELKGATEAIVGADAILSIQRYNFSIGFFGTNGISSKAGFSTPDLNEALIKQMAIKNTDNDRRYILSDSSKFGQISSVTFCDIEDSSVITDMIPDDRYKKLSRIIIAG